MISEARARGLVNEWIRTRSEGAESQEPEVLEARTLEREWGWVFFVSTGGEQGEGRARAYLVNRESGTVQETGTAEPVEVYVQRYEAQLERARKTWALHVSDPPSKGVLKTLRAVLRVKRFELPDLERRLPGVVRRGARADLEPLCERLCRAGVSAEIRRSADADQDP